MITRFAVIDDSRKILLGIDKAEVFEPGYVYEASKILDEIIIKKIGKYALVKEGSCPCENSDINTLVYYGNHLITQKELDFSINF